MKELTLADQGEFCYTISASNEPRLRIEPGETVRIETEDTTSGQIKKEGDVRDRKKVPYANPQSGPIYVNGAKDGDTLAVKIEDIRPLTDRGITRIVSFWYASSQNTSLIHKFLDVEGIVPDKARICKIRDSTVYFDRFALPYRPMIGTVGTANPVETRLSAQISDCGGNMDIPEVTTGATLYLPVRVEGALLHLGDVHAIQGDGELAGSGVEIPSSTTLTIDVIREEGQQAARQARIENNDAIYSIATTKEGRGLEDAIHLAYLDLVMWIERKYSVDRWLAFELVSLTAKIRLGNLWAVAVGMPRKYLEIGK